MCDVKLFFKAITLSHICIFVLVIEFGIDHPRIRSISIPRVCACYKGTGDALLWGKTLSTSIMNLLRILRPPS